ncbi:MAG TPA: outer membrane beta-barrel protein, partial [Chitinophaga sp.]
LNGKYFAGSSETRSSSQSNNQQTIGDTVLLTHSTGKGNRTYLDNGLSFKASGKRDSTITWRYIPTIRFGHRDSWNNSESATGSNFNAQLNDQLSATESHGSYSSYGHTLGGAYNFKKKGRTLTFFQYLSTNTDKSNDTTHVASNYYLTDEHSVLDQYKRNTTGGTDITSRLYYAEPVSRTSTLTLNLNSAYNKSDNQLQTYNRDTVTHALSALDPHYSNESHRESWQNSVALGYRLQLGELRLSVSGELQQQYIHTTFGPRFAPVTQRITNVLPSLNLSWKGLNLYYYKYVNLPSAANIQPLPDSSNPLNITIGNPHLRPSVQQQLAAYYQFMKGENTLSVFGALRFNSHDVFSNRTVDGQGAQVTTLENINGQWGTYMGFEGRLKVRKTDSWNLYVRASTFNRIDKTFIAVNGAHSGEVVYTAAPRAGLDINLHDVFDFSSNYSLEWSHATFESKAYTAQETVLHLLSGTATFRLPKHFVWETNLTYRFNGALAPGISRNNYLWNASASYLFGKEHRAQLKVSVFDLLNQHVNLTRSVHENYVSDYQSTVLQRYGMISLIYNIRGFRAR